MENTLSYPFHKSEGKEQLHKDPGTCMDFSEHTIIFLNLSSTLLGLQGWIVCLVLRKRCSLCHPLHDQFLIHTYNSLLFFCHWMFENPCFIPSVPNSCKYESWSCLTLSGLFHSGYVCQFRKIISIVWLIFIWKNFDSFIEVSFVFHKVHLFKVNSLRVFSMHRVV